MSVLCAVMRELVQMSFGAITHQRPYHVQAKFL